MLNGNREVYRPSDINLDATISDLLIYCNESKEIYGNLILDISKIPPVNSTGVLNLIGVSIRVHQLTNQPLVLKNLSNSLFEYMSRLFIHKIDTIKIDYNSIEEDGYEQFHYQNINLARLYNLQTSSDQAALVRYIKQFLDVAFEYKEKRKLARVVTMILELTGNCIEHSSITGENTITYFILENIVERDHTNSTSRVKSVRFSLGDFGMGIKSNIRLYNPDFPDDDLFCIKKALEDGVTGRSDKRGGLGFGSIQEIMKNFEGSFRISSGDTSLVIADLAKEERRKAYLPGTQFEIILNT